MDIFEGMKVIENEKTKKKNNTCVHTHTHSRLRRVEKRRMSATSKPVRRCIVMVPRATTPATTPDDREGEPPTVLQQCLNAADFPHAFEQASVNPHEPAHPVRLYVCYHHSSKAHTRLVPLTDTVTGGVLVVSGQDDAKLEDDERRAKQGMDEHVAKLEQQLTELRRDSREIQTELDRQREKSMRDADEVRDQLAEMQTKWEHKCRALAKANEELDALTHQYKELDEKCEVTVGERNVLQRHVVALRKKVHQQQEQEQDQQQQEQDQQHQKEKPREPSMLDSPSPRPPSSTPSSLVTLPPTSP